MTHTDLPCPQSGHGVEVRLSKFVVAFGPLAGTYPWCGTSIAFGRARRPRAEVRPIIEDLDGRNTTFVEEAAALVRAVGVPISEVAVELGPPAGTDRQQRSRAEAVSARLAVRAVA